MGLADLLIYCGENLWFSRRQSISRSDFFETIAITAYEASIDLAKEKGSFPFLIGKDDPRDTKHYERSLLTQGI